MAKVSPLQGNFNTGEVSPLLFGRVDQDRYASSLAKCLNYIPTIQGGLIRRSGTKFISEVKDSSKLTRLVRFEFSTTQAYMIEFGDQYFRFYRDYGLITLTPQNITGITKANPAVVTYAGSDTYANGDRIVITGVLGMTEVNNREFRVANVNTGTNTFELQDGQTAANIDSTGYTTYASGGTVAEVYEIASPYAEADLFQLKFTQSADVLYIVHPSYAPRKLSRTGHTNWTIADIDFLDGPYLNENTTATTLTPSAATGSGVTLTASAITGINDDTGFQSTDVGRLIRMKQGSVWGYVKITGYTSTTVVTVTVINTLTSTAAKTAWCMGVWSGTTGYPGCCVFFEDRLFFAGAPDSPQRLDGSNSGDYENFAPSDTAGTITSSNALGFTLNSNDVQVIRWMTSDEKGLLSGTVKGEWVVRPSSQNEALSPTNITAKQATSYGSDNIAPVQADKATLFVQRAGRKIRELIYFYDVDGFKAPDLTVLSEHITQSGVVELAFQREPQSIVWVVRFDGTLSAMTYERDLDALRVGWARHVMGGYSDTAQSMAICESVSVIPSIDVVRDDVWVIVRREINGAVKRCVEFIERTFFDEIEHHDAFFVDSGLSYDSPLEITNATQASPVVVTSASHGLSNGDRVIISNVVGMEELNGNTYKVAGVTLNTFELTNSSDADIDGTDFNEYVSGGYVRKLVTTITGLFHLEGETVSILGDGAVQPSKTVTNGKITLSEAAGRVHVGYGFNSDAQMVRLEAGASNGTSIGKIRRTHRAGFMLHRSLGLKIGLSFDELTTLTFRTGSNPGSRAPELFSGILVENLEANYDYDNQICWRQDQPLPSVILAVMPDLVTQER
jgi:hypothetical protein